MNDPEKCLLFRPIEAGEHEQEPAKEVWGGSYYELRSQLPYRPLVVGRFSCLPHYWEVEKEVRHLGGRLIHPKEVHSYISEMRWVNDLGNTPETWFQKGWANVPETEHGWVVKGRTNSRKFQWDSMMYAETRDDLKEVMSNLRKDSRINSQGLVIREYIPLEKFDEGINGMPISNEWRFFFLNNEDTEVEVASGFYWDITEKADEMNEVPEGAREVAREANAKMDGQFSGLNGSFFGIDVGKTEEGDWIVIEVNDGQQSGLSTIDPKEFHKSLFREVETLL